MNRLILVDYVSEPRNFAESLGHGFMIFTTKRNEARPWIDVYDGFYEAKGLSWWACLPLLFSGCQQEVLGICI